jgi:replication factor C small subunit
MKELWVEKYRPKTLKEYVVRDEAQRSQIQTWINDKAIPHLLLSGAPGVGKTTLAKVLFQELEVSSYDILEINASRENSVDTVREKINSFVQIMPFGAELFQHFIVDVKDSIWKQLTRMNSRQGQQKY